MTLPGSRLQDLQYWAIAVSSSVKFTADEQII